MTKEAVGDEFQVFSFQQGKCVRLISEKFLS